MYKLILSKKICKFYIIVIVTTPPKRILKPIETLVELGCVPSALLHFGIQGISTVAINNMPSHMRAPFLNSDVMNSLSTPTAAVLAATKSRYLIYSRNY